MPQPQVESDETVVPPSEGGPAQRTPDQAGQPAKLLRPLEESARLANQRTTHNLVGVNYNVTPENGYRKA